MSHISIISVTQTDKILTDETKAILLDVRECSDFNKSHHPKAQLLTEPMVNMLLTSVNKCTPLILYCYHGNISQDIAHLFSDFGFMRCYSVDGGYTAWKYQKQSQFPLSARGNKWLKENKLDSQDINANADVHLRSPLMLAAKAGRAEIVHDLIEAGANPNQKDLHGNNSLWYALQGQNAACIRLLINADVEVDNRNCFGFTALHYAVGMENMCHLMESGLHMGTIAKMHRPPGSGRRYNRLRNIASQLTAVA